MRVDFLKTCNKVRVNNMTAMNEMLQWVRDTLPMDLDWPRMIEDKIESLIEKEKEQIINAYINGYTSWDSEMSGFEYYTQTHNKNK